jgi:hypothetical protein
MDDRASAMAIPLVIDNDAAQQPSLDAAAVQVTVAGGRPDRAAQPGGSARTPLVTHLNEGSNQLRTLVMAG